MGKKKTRTQTKKQKEKTVIFTLTDVQEQGLDRVRDHWIEVARRTGPPHNPRLIEKTFERIYAAAKLPSPVIVWHPSPIAGALFILKTLEGSKTATVYGKAIEHATTVKNKIQTTPALLQTIEKRTRDAIGEKLGMVALIGCEMVDRVTPTKDSVLAPVLTTPAQNTFEKQMQDCILSACFGQHEAAKLGLFDFYGQAFGIQHELDSWFEIANQVGWFWTFEKPAMVVITERPTILRLDEQSHAHAALFPAIEYADQFAVWAWHGERVPQEMIQKPSDIAWPDILGLNDAALKDACAEIKAYAWAGPGDEGKERFEAARTTKQLGGLEALRDFLAFTDTGTDETNKK